MNFGFVAAPMLRNVNSNTVFIPQSELIVNGNPVHTLYFGVLVQKKRKVKKSKKIKKIS